MTREEAIKTLRELWRETNDPWYEEVYNMAIEALSVETHEIRTETHGVCSDLISRADAIELLTEIVFNEPPYLDSETLCRLYAEEQINALPSADRPSWEWIPCSEKMPEDGQGVIICTDDNRFKDHPVGTCIYEDGSFHTAFHDDISIIAWMPLPKPYRPNCGAKMGSDTR